MNAVYVVIATSIGGLLIVAFASWHSSDPANPIYVSHPEGTMLAVNFAHADHIEQSCVVCHHNYVDTTGQGMCFDCHITDPQVSALIETQFHELCRTCHVDKQNQGEDHGPTRQCIDCHQHDERP